MWPVAIMLILMHFRSAFVICMTLPLAVLFAFLMMWLLRVLHIIDVQANIMSLAGITISIGILVDQAIVMVENATHQLKDHFGDKKVTGDTRDIVIRACRPWAGPSSSPCMIILISFIPVFAMSGREGKLFHPMAFTKSLAMIGVALICGDGGAGPDPDVHPRQAAPRGRQLDRPQLHPHLQAGADLGAAPAQFRHVVLRRAADPGGGHVPVAGGPRSWAPRTMTGKSSSYVVLASW